MMKRIQINKKDWAAGIERAKTAYRVYGPVKEKEDYEFRALDKGQLPDLQFKNTRLSPKSIVFPQSEVMFTYSLDESREDCRILKDVKADDALRAVIGIRPCDALSFPIVRRNFDTPEFQDTYWIRAYEATTFIGLACATPCHTCFCTSAGTGPFGTEGLDLLLIEDGERFYADVLTPKGEAFMTAAGWNSPADEKAAARIETLKAKAESAVTSVVHTENLKNKTILELYDAPFWEEEAFACINCGTCTFVCPTCWCFDIQDETFGKTGVRMRNWDSCMFPLFTLHASGHNPRPQKYERVRQRFMHKLKYYVDKYDNGIQCVGCGRCIRSCPVNIDIRRICNRMNSFEPDACASSAAASS